MGVSTNAILFYGYCWDEEGVELLPEGKDWDDVVAEKRGHFNPWQRFVEPTGHAKDMAEYKERERIAKAFGDEHRAEIDAYYAVEKAIREEFACDIGHHCSGECSIPYIYVKETHKVARRGCPETINPQDLLHKPTWNNALIAFCQELGIKWPTNQGAQWWLVSYWN